LGRFAANGKISDLSAAAILGRVERVRGWAPLYTAQWHRIARIAIGIGFEVFLEPLPTGVIGFVALLAPGPVPRQAIRQSRLPLAKYYPPLAERPNARALFERNVCVAAHPGMAALDDARIEEELSLIVTSVKERQ
jgi:hypothetical protein